MARARSYDDQYVTPLLARALPYLKAGWTVSATAQHLQVVRGTLGAHWWRYRFPDNFKKYEQDRDSHRQRALKEARSIRALSSHDWDRALTERWEDRKKRRAAEKLAAKLASCNK